MTYCEECGMEVEEEDFDQAVDMCFECVIELFGEEEKEEEEGED